MVTQTSVQRTTKCRALKAARKFSNLYLSGVDYTDPSTFIKAKQSEAEYLYNAILTGFSTELVNLFMDDLSSIDAHPYNENIFALTDLLKVWKFCIADIAYDKNMIDQSQGGLKHVY